MVKAMKNKGSSVNCLLERKGKRLLPYLLMSPTLIFVVFFLIVPLGFAFYCSLYRADYMQFSKFLGLGNYIDVLADTEILKSIGRTFYVSGISLVVSLIAGVALALCINALSKKLAYVVQIIVLIPWVTSMIVAAMLWKWIFQDETGLLNYAISKIGLSKIGFLTDKDIAIYTLIFVLTWRVIGYVMVQVLAGLKSIPQEYEEASKIDGANKWKTFWFVRFPLLKTPITISAIIVGLSNINNLNVPLTLLAGGPGTSTMMVAIDIYRMSFTSYHFGESSALSIVLCLINFLLAVIYIKAVKYEI
ncbi:carbohydrate ABC transporter membrane protein 1 (CUT1 family) [Ruminiclostridium sufflavum DSM 19573]|uniref:Carbohydrate ABC transporter membrane protein 1 (CUT1 family) n=1 Tax=Ruminiclostridium sufflavum DSM 19573 TaxID=1121337 RepID=A0A318XKZ3_9FIRM|nr:sugar ABC transporter permease [Ruminiclostridium sufflavum]PYG87128.1 carbohydrate ABC transporter membrane protein 1 (CUT1 family) [Ruminiclostridium sufflavum DSM 19573]